MVMATDALDAPTATTLSPKCNPNVKRISSHAKALDPIYLAKYFC